MPRILIADDQADVLAALSLLLKGERFQIESASSPEGVLKAIDVHELDVVLIDLNYARDTTSGSEGLDLLSRIRAADPTLPVVVMTAWGSVDLAVEAMRRGARDFIQKPWDNARLLAVLRTQVELGEALRRGRRLEAENMALRDSVAEANDLPQVVVAESPAMKSVLNLVERIGPADANVLITGENGTGKEVITRLLHSISSRRAKPLISLNAGALAEGVFESELFGHVRGAFTDAKSDRVGRFELADGGTLFLDEIGNVPLNLQAKLLRVLETGEFERVGSSKTQKVNVRLLSATNADLHAEVAQGMYLRVLEPRGRRLAPAIDVAAAEHAEQGVDRPQPEYDRHRPFPRKITLVGQESRVAREDDAPIRERAVTRAGPGLLLQREHEPQPTTPPPVGDIGRKSWPDP